MERDPLAAAVTALASAREHCRDLNAAIKKGVDSPAARGGGRPAQEAHQEAVRSALYSTRDALTALHSASENLAQELARRDVKH